MIATQATIEAETGLSEEIAEKAVRYRLTAETYCRGLLGTVDLSVYTTADAGDEQYDAVVAAGTLDPADLAFRKLVRAESLLAAAEALKASNLRVTEKGGFVRSTGFDASRQGFMSQRELSAYQQQYRREADRLLSSLRGFREPLYAG